MIEPKLRAEILRLYHAERWPVGTIASQLGVHHTTVQRALVEDGVTDARRSKRLRMVDQYLPFILQTLERYPRLHASRLFEMVRQRGYTGRPDHFRHVVALYRPRPTAEAYLRLKTLPGEQAQVDWGHFGKLRIGQAERSLMAFVMVLSWSRQIVLRFFLGGHMASFLRGHVAAFETWGGVPRVLLYDNLKSAVLERTGDAIRFHPTLVELSAHYRFEPRPVALARGNEKGRVEAAIHYIRTSFFEARTFADVDDLNAQALTWTHEIADTRRCPEDRGCSVAEAFARERNHLLPLPDWPFVTDEHIEVSIRKTPYARFDGNDYSVPHTKVQRTLLVVASLEQVRILDGSEVVASHPRSFGRGDVVEDQAHIQALLAAKRHARQHRATDRLGHAAPSSGPMLVALAERGANLGSATAALLRLLDAFGAVELEAAVVEALATDAPHPHAVRLILDRRRRERGQPPPLAIHLPDDPRVRDLLVRPHRLDDYDPSREDSNENDLV